MLDNNSPQYYEFVVKTHPQKIIENYDNWSSINVSYVTFSRSYAMRPRAEINYYYFIPTGAKAVSVSLVPTFVQDEGHG